MYVEPVPNRHSPPAILLRESYRKDGKVLKRTLANLSHWEPARVQALRRALRGDFDHLVWPDPTSGLVFGLLFALKHLADSLGLTAALGKTRLAKLALFLVLARVAHQGARLSAVRWAANHAVTEVLGLGSFDEEDLYAALDDLCARQEKSSGCGVGRCTAVSSGTRVLVVLASKARRRKLAPSNRLRTARRRRASNATAG